MIATRVQRRLRTVVTAALLMMSLGDANSTKRFVQVILICTHKFVIFQICMFRNNMGLISRIISIIN